MTIPESIVAAAVKAQMAPMDLWMTILAKIRDEVYLQAHEDDRVFMDINDAILVTKQFYPWIPDGEERWDVAWQSMTFGISCGYWTLQYTLKGLPVSQEEMEHRIAEDNLEGVVIDFPLCKSVEDETVEE